MKIKIEENEYQGTGTEIMAQLHAQVFDTLDLPDTESYILFVRDNIVRTTGLDFPLPNKDTEAKARTVLYQLAKVGALVLLEDD